MFKHGGYVFRFRHFQVSRKAIEELNKEGQHILFAEKTVCTVNLDTDSKDDKPLIVGVALCSLKDQFSREKGRELSFERALHQLIPNTQKDVRLNFWKAFWVSVDGVNTAASVYAWCNEVISTEEVTAHQLRDE